MKTCLGITLLASLATIPVMSQGLTPPPVSFSVASLKRNQELKARYRVVREATRIKYTAAPLRFLILHAYEIEPYLLKGPSWLIDERYDVDALLPDDASPAQVPVVLQQLLIERLKLVTHRETKDGTIYVLSVAPAGLKLQPHISEGGSDKYAGVPDVVDSQRGRLYINGAISMSTLVTDLVVLMGHPVFDKTGLEGKYDVILDADTGGAPSPDMPAPVLGDGTKLPESAPSIFKVLARLGLALDVAHAPLEYLVVDSVNKIPIAN